MHATDHEELLAYSKLDPTTGDQILVVVTLNPAEARQGTVSLDMAALGLGWDDTVEVRDEVTGQSFRWGEHNFVRLLPWDNVAHILSVPRPAAIAPTA